MALCAPARVFRPGLGPPPTLLHLQKRGQQMAPPLLGPSPPTMVGDWAHSRAVWRPCWSRSRLQPPLAKWHVGAPHRELVGAGCLYVHSCARTARRSRRFMWAHPLGQLLHRQHPLPRASVRRKHLWHVQYVPRHAGLGKKVEGWLFSRDKMSLKAKLFSG